MDDVQPQQTDPKGHRLGIRGWVNSIFTEADDRTPDAVNILWALGILAFLAFTGYTVYRTGTFDMQGFGIGFGTTMASGAGARWAKQKSGF